MYEMNDACIILKPNDIVKVANLLKKRDFQYYLFFEILRQTGCTGSKIIGCSIEEMLSFIKENKQFVSKELYNDILSYSEDKEGFFFRGIQTRNEQQHLSLRTVENVIKRAGIECGINNVSIRNMPKQFYYEYFRKSGFDFETLRSLLKERRRYMPSLKAFLNYCGLTEEQYYADIADYSSSRINNTKYKCQQIITYITSVLGTINTEGTTATQNLELIITIDLIYDMIFDKKAV